MKRRINRFAVIVTLGLVAFSSREKTLTAGNKYPIALIPGRSKDASYITMPPNFKRFIYSDQDRFCL